MGSDLRRWLADHLPADVPSGERLVALEAADCAWDETRIARQADLLEKLIRRTGFSDAKQIGKVLGKLAARGIELRLPVRNRNGEIVTDKRGRVVYACRGHELELRIPTEEECPALKVPPRGDQTSSPVEGTNPDSSPHGETFEGEKAPPLGPNGPPPGPNAPPLGPKAPPSGGPLPLKTTKTPEEEVTTSPAPGAANGSLDGPLILDSHGREQPPAETRDYQMRKFGAFWWAYPRRKSQEAAEQAWRDAMDRGDDPDHIVAAATAYAHERAGEPVQYTPYPATWLKGRRYNDEPDPDPPPQTNGRHGGGWQQQETDDLFDRAMARAEARMQQENP